MATSTDLSVINIEIGEKSVILPSNAIVEVIDLTSLQVAESSQFKAVIDWRGQVLTVVHPAVFLSQEKDIVWPKRAIVIKAISYLGYYAIALFNNPKIQSIPTESIFRSVDLESDLLKAEFKHNAKTYVVIDVEQLESYFELMPMNE